MLKGRLCSAGNLNVDGDNVIGIFIECSREDLRNHSKMLFTDVEVRPADERGMAALQYGEAPSQKLKASIALVRELSGLLLATDRERFLLSLTALEANVSFSKL